MENLILCETRCGSRSVLGFIFTKLLVGHKMHTAKKSKIDDWLLFTKPPCNSWKRSSCEKASFFKMGTFFSSLKGYLILYTDVMYLLTVNYYNVLHLEPGKTNRLVVRSPGQIMHAMNEAQKQRRNRDTALVDMAKLCEAKVGLEDGWRVGHVVEICWNPYFSFRGGGY